MSALQKSRVVCIRFAGLWSPPTMTSLQGFLPQSRAQSFSGFLSAVGRRKKLWDNEISLNIL